MKNLKNLLAAVTLFGVMMLGTYSAKANVSEFETPADPNGGIIITENQTSDTDDTLIEFWGIIITEKGGIIITEKNGIIITE